MPIVVALYRVRAMPCGIVDPSRHGQEQKQHAKGETSVLCRERKRRKKKCMKRKGSTRLNSVAFEEPW